MTYQRAAIHDSSAHAWIYPPAEHASNGGSKTGLATAVLHLERGAFDADGVTSDPDGWLGLLVLDGLLLVELAAGRGRAGALIGPDDLIRPWDKDQISVAQGARWRALTPSRLALLDSRFRQRASVRTVSTLLTRASYTNQWLLAKSLILSSPVIRDRLLLLFALLGERWGKVTTNGVRLDLPLNHALLATLCGCSRPTVTVSLHSLQADGLLTRAPRGGWILGAGHHQPSPASCQAHYAYTLGLQ